MQTHKTVLLEETVAALEIEPTDTIVDATFGSGGHAAKVLDRLGKNGHYIGIDVDKTALRHPINQFKNATLVCGNFRQLNTLLCSLSKSNPDGILADLGWRMEQFSGSGKGFSFQHDEPLLMTLGESNDYLFTATDIVNDWEEENLADIIYGYGEERFARRIARAIVNARRQTTVTTSGQLADIVTSAIPAVARRGRLHPATKTFQALRMVVNDELGALQDFIQASVDCLKPTGNLAIITFHSLEDGIVKHRFREISNSGTATNLTKKPITPNFEEIAHNPRARSAKLRILKKN